MRPAINDIRANTSCIAAWIALRPRAIEYKFKVLGKEKKKEITKRYLESTKFWDGVHLLKKDKKAVPTK